MNLNCAEASYDIQYGFVNRPTHRNTSWDAAKFVFCFCLLVEGCDVSF